MKKFLFCLAPSILAYLIVIVTGMSSSTDDSVIWLAMGLILVGALMSGGLVATSVYEKMKAEKGVKIIVSILCFLGVGVAYFAVSMAGCCGLGMVSGIS